MRSLSHTLCYYLRDSGTMRFSCHNRHTVPPRIRAYVLPRQQCQHAGATVAYTHTKEGSLVLTLFITQSNPLLTVVHCFHAGNPSSFLLCDGHAAQASLMEPARSSLTSMAWFAFLSQKREKSPTGMGRGKPVEAQIWIARRYQPSSEVTKRHAPAA